MTIRTWWFISPLPVFLIPSLNRSTIHVSWDQNPTSQSSSQSERQKQQQKTTTSFWDFETIVSQQINHWRYLLRLHPSTTQSNNQPFTLLPMTLVRPVIQPLMFTYLLGLHPSTTQTISHLHYCLWLWSDQSSSHSCSLRSRQSTNHSHLHRSHQSNNQSTIKPIVWDIYYTYVE